MIKDNLETDAWLHDQGYGHTGDQLIRDLTMIEIKQMKMGRSRLNTTQEYASDPDKSMRDLSALRNKKVRRRKNGN
jgi:hypothetical protein